MEKTGLQVTADELSKLLTTLMGRAAKATPLKAAKPITGAAVSGVFTAPDGEPRVLLVCELKVAACVGAGLAMLPPNQVAEAEKAGKLSEALAENVHEVFNVVASILNREGATHVSLSEVRTGPLPAPLAARTKGWLQRVDFELDIAGYGKGRWSFVADGNPVGW